MKRKIYSELPEWKQKYSTKETLAEKYNSALRQYLGDSEELELLLKRNGFYTVTVIWDGSSIRLSISNELEIDRLVYDLYPSFRQAQYKFFGSEGHRDSFR